MIQGITLIITLIIQLSVNQKSTPFTLGNKAKYLDPKPTLIPSSIKIFEYNADNPLPVCGTFLATASADGNQTETTFYVIPGKSGSLLSKSTAEELNLL